MKPKQTLEQLNQALSKSLHGSLDFLKTFSDIHADLRESFHRSSLTIAIQSVEKAVAHSKLPPDVLGPTVAVLASAKLLLGIYDGAAAAHQKINEAMDKAADALKIPDFSKVLAGLTDLRAIFDLVDKIVPKPADPTPKRYPGGSGLN